MNDVLQLFVYISGLWVRLIFIVPRVLIALTKLATTSTQFATDLKPTGPRNLIWTILEKFPKMAKSIREVSKNVNSSNCTLLKTKISKQVVMGRTPFYRTSNELKHHFWNI